MNAVVAATQPPVRVRVQLGADGFEARLSGHTFGLVGASSTRAQLAVQRLAFALGYSLRVETRYLGKSADGAGFDWIIEEPPQ